MPRSPITRSRPYTPSRGALAGQTFYSDRQYRNALARQKGYGSWHQRQREQRPVRGAKQFSKLRRSEQDARRRALEAVSSMRRDGLSLSAAAKRAGTTPNTIRRHAGSELSRERGRYVASRGDRLYRAMRVLTNTGVVDVGVAGSRQASLISSYWNAVDRYLRTGDSSQLGGFAGRSVAGVEFEADLDVIDELAGRGELEFEDIYEIAA